MVWNGLIHSKPHQLAHFKGLAVGKLLSIKPLSEIYASFASLLFIIGWYLSSCHDGTPSNQLSKFNRKLSIRMSNSDSEQKYEQAVLVITNLGVGWLVV